MSSNLDTYLYDRYKDKVNFTIEDLFEESGFDRDKNRDVILVNSCIRKHLKIQADGYIPTHFSTRRGKDIILELLSS